MTFTLDTNILINLSRQYPRDIFGSIWDSIESAVLLGEVCICEAVLREVKRGGDDLFDWAKNLQGFVCPTTEPELVTVGEIAVAHPEWVRGQKNEGDPFIIAHAKAEGSEIVTEEKATGPGTAEKNLRIPGVAAEHGLGTTKFLDFVRGQGWTY